MSAASWYSPLEISETLQPTTEIQSLTAWHQETHQSIFRIGNSQCSWTHSYVAVFVCFPITSLQQLTHGTQITSLHNTHYAVAYFSEFSCITSWQKLQPSSIPKWHQCGLEALPSRILCKKYTGPIWYGHDLSEWIECHHFCWLYKSPSTLCPDFFH